MQQPGGLSVFDPTWPFPTNIPNPLAHRPQYFQFGATPTPSINEGSNPSVPLNPATQQYPWNPDNSFYTSLDNLSASSLSRRDPYLDTSMGLDQQNQDCNPAGTNQDSVPLYGDQVMREG